MKKIFVLILAALILIGGAAQAERLNMQVMDILSVDAELPEDVPDKLPILDVAAHAFDADLAQALLMPGCEQRAETKDPETGYHDVRFGGDGDGEEFMMVELSSGRVSYWSTFWQLRLMSIMGIDDPMKDTLNYYPEDREVDEFPRADAIKQAEELLFALGIRQGEHLLKSPRVLTVDTASYDVLLQDLKQADFQADIHRRHLEPYDSAHDGYLILYDRAVNGVRFLDQWTSLPLALFISRQGVEYLETEYIYDVLQAGDIQPLLSAEQSLKKAAPEMERMRKLDYYVAGSYLSEGGIFRPSVVERIYLGYQLDADRKQALPIWEFTYPRAMWKYEGNWRTRSLDNPAFLGLIRVDALTGEYIETIQN